MHNNPKTTKVTLHVGQGVTKLMDFYTRYLCADAYIQAVFSALNPNVHLKLIAN